MPPEKQPDSGDSGVLRAATSVGAAVLLSRALGLVREQVFAYFFGASVLTDAFNVAFRIPNLLRNLFAEGAMSAAFIPTLTSTRMHQGDESAWQLSGRVFRVLLVLGSLIALLGILSAGFLVRLYAPSFFAQSGKFEITVRLTRWMFPYFPLVALSAALSGVLNAGGKFFLPALSSAVFNIVSVSCGVLGILAIRAGYGEVGFFGIHYSLSAIEAMAIGVVLGGAAQALVQLPMLYRLGYRYKSSPNKMSWISDPALRKITGMMLPGVVGLAATQLNVLINTWLATSLQTGSVSWLNYAFRFIQFPIGLVGATLATASLPVFSRMWAKGDVVGFAESLEQNLKRILAVSIPASFGLAVMGYPIIEMIFEYGHFGPADTSATSMALAMYAIGLVGYSGVKLLVPACYAMGATRVPVVSSALTVALSTGLSLFFILICHFGFWSLPLATAFGALFNAGFLIYQLNVRFGATQSQGGISLRSLGFYGLAMLLISALMAFVIYESYAAISVLVGGDGPRILVRLLRVIPVLLEGVGFMGLFYWMGLFKKNNNFETKP